MAEELILKGTLEGHVSLPLSHLDTRVCLSTLPGATD